MRARALPFEPAMARPRRVPYTWIEPPATSSAPEATEPSTVTSPSGKKMDWPERTGLSSRSVAGSWSRGLRLVARRRLGHLCTRRTTAAQKWRQARTELGRICVLNPHGADVAPLQLADQVRDCGLAQRHRGQVEDDRSADEKTSCAANPFVDLGEPFDDRRLGREHERHVRTADKTHGLTGTNDGWHTRLPVFPSGSIPG